MFATFGDSMTEGLSKIDEDHGTCVINEAPRSPALAGRGIKRNCGVANPLMKIELEKLVG